MRLDNDQYEEIKRTVIDTFVEYNIKGTPISGFEMAVKMGIKIIPYSSLSENKLSAAIKISKDGYSLTDTITNEWIIFYNDMCQNYGRINQTIMHEIGHFAMGHIDDGAEEEAEAKFFAKYALAPPPLIHMLIPTVNPCAIMKTFDISYEAAVNAFRYYRNWLKYGNTDYTDYEKEILYLFEVI